MSCSPCCLIHSIVLFMSKVVSFDIVPFGCKGRLLLGFHLSCFLFNWIMILMSIIDLIISVICVFGISTERKEFSPLGVFHLP